MSKPRVPAIEGWFTDDAEPRLIGLKDPQSGTYFFPKDVAMSRAPGYADVELEEVKLSRTGKLWSYDRIERTVSTAAVADGRLYVADLPGRVHCLDPDTGH